MLNCMVLAETLLGIILSFLCLQSSMLFWDSYWFVAPLETLSDLQQLMFYFIQIPNMKQYGNLLLLVMNLKKNHRRAIIALILTVSHCHLWLMLSPLANKATDFLD